MAKVGVVQMCSGAVPEKNLQQLRRSLNGLHLQGTELVVTPENAIVFGSVEDYEQYAEPLDNGPIQSELKEMATHFELWLIVGSMPIRKQNGNIATTCLVIDDKGEMRASYEKLHMFDVDVEDKHHCYRESDIFEAGEAIQLVDTPVGRVGLSICYDIRFPQLYSELRRQGADVIVVPAAFTKVTGRAHWDVLLRARAIETQCWIVAAAQWGEHNAERETWGHSMIIDPWGNIEQEQKEGTGVLVSDVDIEMSKTIRQRMPITDHIRFESSIKLIKKN